MGRNGRNALATSTLSTLPKFELAVILMYLMTLPKVRRPSITPCSSTSRLFSSRMMSAASFATSTAVSTEMPTSASRNAVASLIPSPMKPTVWPRDLRARTTRAFCNGESLAKTVVHSARSASASSSSGSTSEPVATCSTASPTVRQILRATTALSPVREETMPSAARTPLNGCRIEAQRTSGQPGGFWLASSLGPNSASRRCTLFHSRPSEVEANRPSTVA